MERFGTDSESTDLLGMYFESVKLADVIKQRRDWENAMTHKKVQTHRKISQQCPSERNGHYTTFHYKFPEYFGLVLYRNNRK